MDSSSDKEMSISEASRACGTAIDDINVHFEDVVKFDCERGRALRKNKEGDQESARECMNNAIVMAKKMLSQSNCKHRKERETLLDSLSF